MPLPSQTADLEREAAKRPMTDQLHQPDQSLHQQEIDKLRHKTPAPRKEGDQSRQKKK